MRNLLVVMGLFGLFNMDCVNAGAGSSVVASHGQRGDETRPSCSQEELRQFCERLRELGNGSECNFSGVTPENVGNRWGELCRDEFFVIYAVTAECYGIAEFLIQQRNEDIGEESLCFMLSACINCLQRMVNRAMRERKNNQNQTDGLDSELQAFEDSLVYFSPQDKEKFIQMVKFIVFLVEKKGIDIMNVEYSNGKTVRMLLTELVDRIISPDFSMVLQLLSDNKSLQEVREAMNVAVTLRMVDDWAEVLDFN